MLAKDNPYYVQITGDLPLPLPGLLEKYIGRKNTVRLALAFTSSFYRKQYLLTATSTLYPSNS